MNQGNIIDVEKPKLWLFKHVSRDYQLKILIYQCLIQAKDFSKTKLKEIATNGKNESFDYWA